jgi:ubiquinone/menaquinone biosynthesis C-methylase UbiE
VFPAICDFFLRQPNLASYRRELLESVNGEILEIGFGTGLNLTHYPPHVRHISAVDSNPGMNRRAAKRIAQAGILVDHQVLDCERLPFADNSFDCVISTFTLCSIADVHRALVEAHRVLKPQGRFLFLEHGLSPDAKVQRWQRRLNWLQNRIAGGCHLDRNMRELVGRQPFADITVAEFDLPETPKIFGHVFRGVACK